MPQRMVSGNQLFAERVHSFRRHHEERHQKERIHRDVRPDEHGHERNVELERQIQLVSMSARVGEPVDRWIHGEEHHRDHADPQSNRPLRVRYRE